MKQMLVVQVDKCVGCKSCEIACAVEHSASQVLPTAITESPSPQSRVHVMQGASFAAPLQCRQCEDAACVAVCPTRALQKDDEGPVVLERDLCIGCMWCVEACPFGVITVDSSGSAVVKCDQCYARAAQGRMPACVQACPTRAIEQRGLKDVVDGKRNAFMVQIERATQETTS